MFPLSVLLNRAARVVAALAIASAVVASANAQQLKPIHFARNAGIANDGRVAFTYQDDIWLVDADGSNPRRLTVNVARDFSPRFSPDGKWIAFTSNRTGNNDVFVMPSTGGEPRQLTWFSGADEALVLDARRQRRSSSRARAGRTPGARRSTSNQSTADSPSRSAWASRARG